jgi:protein-export membrane protein SecD
MGLVLIFMIAYYRLPGFLADIALVVYTLAALAIFKLVPVTMSIPGIAGFILSIGMAVDANILIFERTKEELALGKSLYNAIEAGFKRAFTSIFDSNMTTIISCIVLFYFGTGMVRGFALTLAIGVFVSMFSAITVTRSLLRAIIGFRSFKNPALYGLKLPG